MRKLTFSVFVPFAFVGATSLVACSFQMRAGSDPNNPNNAQPGRSAQPATPASTPATPTGPGPKVIKASGRKPTPTPPPSSNTPPTPPPPAGAAIVTGTTIFGGSTADPAGLKGSIFFTSAGLTAMPDLSGKPNGFLFTSTLNVTPQAFTGGFPGVEATRTTNFGIRYEGPLVVGTEADYDFRLVSDDGAKLFIDGTAIVDNDGAKTAPTEKTAPVHLVVGAHVLLVDYFQTSGNVALQVFCKKAGGTEQICPTKLP